MIGMKKSTITLLTAISIFLIAGCVNSQDLETKKTAHRTPSIVLEIHQKRDGIEEINKVIYLTPHNEHYKKINTGKNTVIAEAKNIYFNKETNQSVAKINISIKKTQTKTESHWTALSSEVSLIKNPRLIFWTHSENDELSIYAHTES